MNGLILWGAGGHGKMVLDCAMLSGCFSPISFLDDKPGDWFCGHQVLGGREQLLCAAQLGFSNFLIAIGDNRVRAQCYKICREHSLRPVSVIHPSAIISPSAILSPGTVVMPRAVINAGVMIGQNCIINTGAVVEHDCRIGDHVHISPGAVLGGAVQVRNYVHIGIGAMALPGADIAEGAVVGAGALVLRTVAAGTTVIGVPAKVLSIGQT